MNNFSVLGALRRRWWVVVLLAVAGVVAGALPKPAAVTKESQLASFSATATLLVNNTESAQSGLTAVSPNQVPLFATVGEVPQRVKAKVGYAGNEAELASQVTVLYDFGTGALTVSTTQTDGVFAELVANTFGDELNGYLAERQDEVYQQRLAAGIARLNALEIQVKDLTSRLGAAPDDPILIAQRDAVSRQYSVAFEQNQELADAPPVLAFTPLQRAQAVEITSDDGGISAPRSRESRGVLGGVAGVALGVGIAILLGALDRRIRTREQAEAVFDLRARVLIPKAKNVGRGLVVVGGRHDPLSDSYRTLRNVVSFVHSTLEPVHRARITLVVSPGPGEGKTTLAANLAAAMVETGQRTIVVNTDFRRPRLDGVVTTSPPPELPYELGELSAIDPRWLLNKTATENLSLLDLKSMDGSAGDLARATAHVLPQLAETTDAIVIDTSPLGATAEVLELVPLADVIVVVARVGLSSTRVAQRAIDVLRDVSSAPMVLVLTGLRAERSLYYEYSDKPSRRERAASAPKPAASKADSKRKAKATAKSDTGKPDSGKPDSGRSDSGKPDSGKPNGDKGRVETERPGSAAEKVT